MKKIYVSFGLAFAALSYTPDVSAVPAYRGAISHMQPDGSTVEIFRSGDENYHELRDAEGHLIDIDDDGWIVRLDEKSAAMRKAKAVTRKKYLFSGNPFPAKDAPRALVILAAYPDRAFSMDDPHDFYTRLLNEEGFSDYGATGSARDFFVQNSDGLFRPQFDVYGPVVLPNKLKYYGSNDVWGDDAHPEEVAIDAVTLLDDTVDFSIYDTNNDGQIDNVFIFYAGYGEADSNMKNTIWPHSADIRDFKYPEPFIFDGVELNRYGMTNEVDYSYKRPDGVGTFVHEFSHVLGLPDLYSTNYSSAYTPGRFSTLDYGPYNNEGRTPPHYSIFERYCLDWLEPMLLEGDQTLMLDPVHKSNRGYIVRSAEDPDEFYLFENRQKEGWDEYIPGHGMIVWHVTFDQNAWDQNTVNNIASFQRVDLVEADNLQSDINRRSDTFPGEKNVTAFTPETKPAFVSRDGRDLGVSITDIQEKDGRIILTTKLLNTSVDNISADGGLLISTAGPAVTNISDAKLEIFDTAGRRVAILAPSSTAELTPGLYIINSEGKARKIMIGR